MSILLQHSWCFLLPAFLSYLEVPNVLSPFRTCNFEFLVKKYSSVSVVAGLAGFKRIYWNTMKFCRMEVSGWCHPWKTLIWQFWASPRYIFYSNNETSIISVWNNEELHAASISLTFRSTFVLKTYLKLYSRERTLFATFPPLAPLSQPVLLQVIFFGPLNTVWCWWIYSLEISFVLFLLDVNEVIIVIL